MSVGGSGCPACEWSGVAWKADLCSLPCPRCGGYSHHARAREGIDPIDDAAPVEREAREALRRWHMERAPGTRPVLHVLTEGR